MRLGLESGSPGSPELGVTTLSRTYTLSPTLGRVKCEVVDGSGMIWALVNAAIRKIYLFISKQLWVAENALFQKLSHVPFQSFVHPQQSPSLRKSLSVWMKMFEL